MSFILFYFYSLSCFAVRTYRTFCYSYEQNVSTSYSLLSADLILNFPYPRTFEMTRDFDSSYKNQGVALILFSLCGDLLKERYAKISLLDFREKTNSGVESDVTASSVCFSL